MTQPYTPQLPFSYEPGRGRILDAVCQQICMMYLNHEAVHARLIVEAVNAHADLLAALEQIANHPEGTYNRDRKEYLQNVIAWCQETAATAIAKAKGGTP